MEKLMMILQRILCRDDIVLHPNMLINADLGISSFDLFQVISAMEDEFNIDIPNEKTRKIIRIQDLVDCIPEETSNLNVQ